MWFNRPTTDRNYSGEQTVSFESPVPFSKCLRAKIYCNMNVHFDPQGCQTLLLKESEPFILSLGSWTTFDFQSRTCYEITLFPLKGFYLSLKKSTLPPNAVRFFTFTSNLHKMTSCFLT